MSDLLQELRERDRLVRNLLTREARINALLAKCRSRVDVYRAYPDTVEVPARRLAVHQLARAERLQSDWRTEAESLLDALDTPAALAWKIERRLIAARSERWGKAEYDVEAVESLYRTVDHIYRRLRRDGFELPAELEQRSDRDLVVHLQRVMQACMYGRPAMEEAPIDTAWMQPLDKEVLEVLAARKLPIFIVDLVEHVSGSARTVGPRLQVLLDKGLVRHPEGRKKGFIITSVGRRVLERLR